MNDAAGLGHENENGFLPPGKRRYYPRHRTQTIVSCNAFTSNIPESGTEGNVSNFSEDGFYMETHCKYPVATTLLIRVIHYSERKTTASVPIGPKSICLAQVRWRCEVSDKDAVRYGMGLRYIK